MRDDVDFLPARDLLLRDAPLAYVIDVPVLGIETRFASNSRFVINLVEETFGGWSIVRDGEHATETRAVVRIIVFDAAASSGIRHVALDAERVIGFSSGSVGLSDPARGESVIYATCAVVADREQFRATMLEAMTMALLSAFDRHPLHAAAIACDGRAILLAGPSGSGKSTLAHFAHGAGFDVLSEDTVWIQLEPTLRVWGWPGFARLFTGETNEKSRVPLANTQRPACYAARDAVICLLDRAESAGLERVDSNEIFSALTTSLAPGFDRFPERDEAVARRLANGGGWRLTLSRNPTDALPLLTRMLSDD
jgi:hypothetical protein